MIASSPPRRTRRTGGPNLQEIHLASVSPCPPCSEVADTAVLQPHKIQFNLPVAALARPDVERRARDLGNQRYGAPKPHWTDRLKEPFRRVPRVHSQITERRRSQGTAPV